MTSKIQVPLGEESPLQKAFDKFDINHMDWGFAEYQQHALQVSPEQNNKLLVQDLQWRYDHKRNFVASIEGSQGIGKSCSFIYLCLLIAKIFKKAFTIAHIVFSPEDLDKALENAEPCETFLMDEYRKANVGMMANMIGANLADYEDQLRKHQNNLLFASVDLQSHSHFFCFEGKNIVMDKTGYPKMFYAMLKTPRYTDRRQFVWRGFVTFPMPNEKFMAEYDAKKDQHLKNLKAKYGNTLNAVGYHAKAIFEKRKNDLCIKDKNGLVKPIKYSLMNMIVAEEIGTRKFTSGGYKILNDLLKKMVSDAFEEENEVRQIALDTEKQLKLREKEEERKQSMELIEARKHERMQLLKERQEMEAKKLELKERSLALREKEVEHGDHSIEWKALSGSQEKEETQKEAEDRLRSMERFVLPEIFREPQAPKRKKP